jgi:protein-disulfide isomerase-like protein with CxxC motif
MTLTELHQILKATGFPVAYSHFVESDNDPIPDPPFVCYLITYSSNLSADDRVYKQVQNVQIELYTDKKDLEAEAILEGILNDNDLPFGTTETYIESEALFQKIYEVRLL